MKLVRPLREVTMKECAAFLHWRGLGLQVVGNKRVVNKRVEVKAGIGSLTKGELGYSCRYFFVC